MNNNQRTFNLTLNRCRCLEQCKIGFSQEIFYGLEYVADEYFKETKNHYDPRKSVDWFGLSDLTIE